MPNYADRVVVPYRPDQMFDLVADVEKYPQFLPWCTGAKIRSRAGTDLVADLTIGFGPFRESFTSRVSLERPAEGHPGRIRTRYENGPFRYLNNQWVFTAHGNATLVDFWVDFEFRNRLLQKAIGVVFSEAVKRMVSAFRKRAQDVYGAPRIDHVSPQAALPAATRS
jgi:coenzyme Q-binding protein COQ10